MRLTPNSALRLLPALALFALFSCTGDVQGEPDPLRAVKSTPENGASGVSPDTVLSVEFDDELDPASVNSSTLTLAPEAAGGLAAAGKVLTFTPYSPLKPDTTYLATVAGNLRGKKGGKLGASYAVRFSTRGLSSDAVPPADVTDLAATVKSGTSVELTWSASGDDGNKGTATRYDLRWNTGTGCPLKPDNFDAATNVPLPAPGAPGTNESVTVPNLPRKAFACFALKVVDDFGNTSGLSNVVTLTLPDLVAPNPLLIQLAGVQETTADLSWTAVGDDANEGTAADYTLFRTAGSNCDLLGPITALQDGGTALTETISAPQAAGSQESYEASSLTRDSDYCFLLRVRDSAGNPAWSNTLPVHTADLTPPARPTLTGVSNVPTEVRLDWNAVGDDGTSGTVSVEEVEYAEGSCPTGPGTTLTPQATYPNPIPTPGGGASGLSVPSLQPDTTYCFDLRVEDNVGHVVRSNLVQVHTQDVVPPAPPQLSVSNITATTVDVSWVTSGDNDLQGQATEEVMVEAAGADCDVLGLQTFATSNQLFSQTPPSPGSVQTVTVTNLARDEEHCLLLRVADESGLVAYSNVARFTLLDEVPPGIPFVTIAPEEVFSDRVVLRWLAVGDNGITGRASSQEMRFATGDDCAAFGTDAGVAGAPITPALPVPLPPGEPEFAQPQGLAEDTVHCFQLTVEDEVGNLSRSGVAQAKTLDVTAPSTPLLAAGLIPGGMKFNWTAVGDNGSNGTADHNEFVYRKAAAGSTPCPVDSGGAGTQVKLKGGCDNPACGANTVCAALGSATPQCLPVSATCPSACDALETCVLAGGVPTCATRLFSVPVDMKAPGLQQEVLLSNLPTSTRFCAQVRVLDEVGNGAYSNVATDVTDSRDVVPPNAVTDLHATVTKAFLLNAPPGDPLRTDELELMFTAPGDNGTVGTAAKLEAFMAFGDDCNPAAPFALDAGTRANVYSSSNPAPAPGPGGTPQHEATSGIAPVADHLDAACFRVRATDAVGNVSELSNLAFPPAPVGDLAAEADTQNPGKLNLSWTATGANFYTGTAARYVLYSTPASPGCPLTAPPLATLATWAKYEFNASNAGFNYTGPSAAGQVERGTIGGFSAGTRTCFVLQVLNAEQDSALSNVLDFELADVFPPADFTLTLDGFTATTAAFSHSKTGDDGMQGTPVGYELALEAVAAPATPGADPCQGQSINFTNWNAIPAAGTVLVQQLAPDTHYCAVARAVDDAGNYGYSNGLHVHTNPVGAGGDVDPPAQVVLAPFVGSDVRAISSAPPEADLRWDAVREDSLVTGSAPASSYAVVYRTMKADGVTAISSQADCGALGAADAVNAASIPVSVDTSLAVGTPLEAAGVVFTGASPQQLLCAAIRATDDAGNSSVSAWRLIQDNTPPAPLSSFHVLSLGRDSATLSVLVTGDDDTAGAATSYDLSYAPGSCSPAPADFPTVVQGLPAPSVAANGNSDSLTVTGLTAGSSYCFRLVATDDVGLSTPPVLLDVTLSAAASYDLQALRNAVMGSNTLSVTPATALSVEAATVSYVKPDLRTGRPNAPLLDVVPGFFLQGGGDGPAVFAELDPTGLVPGDKVSLTNISASLQAPDASLSLDGIVVVTQATVAKVTPAACPAAACAQGTTCDVGSGRCLANGLEVSSEHVDQLRRVESQLVAAEATLLGAGTTTNGLVTFPVSTQGAAGATNVFLQVPDDVATKLLLAPGMKVQLGGAVLASGPPDVRAGLPLWPHGSEIRFAAWRASDLVVPGVLKPVSPAEGATDVALAVPSIQVILNRASATVPSSLNAPSGPCDETRARLSADGFVQCVGVTVAKTAGAADNSALTLTPTSPLQPGLRYQVSLPGAYVGEAAAVTSSKGFVTVPAETCTARPLVISQLFTPAGGSSGTAVERVEVHNRSATDWNLAATPLEVVFSDGSGTEYVFISLGNQPIPAGGYKTVDVPASSNAPDTGAIVALVSADADGDGVSNADEKLAGTDPFVANAQAGTFGVSCADATQALDRVAFGTGGKAATCGNGERALTPAAGEALVRRVSGCVDLGDNAGDFDAASPVSHAAAASCYCTGDASPNVTDTDAAEEADYCVVQFPTSVTASLTANPFLTVYGRLYEAGKTESGMPHPAGGVVAGFGAAAPGTPLASWTFRNAGYNVNWGNDEEYMYTLELPAAPGTTLRYLFRFSVDNGRHWTYCDTDGAGSNAGLTFSAANEGSVSITP